MKWLLPPVLAGLCLLVMLLLRALLPLSRIFPEPYHYAGIPIALAGIGLMLGGALQFRRVGTNIKPFKDPDLLVTDGVFSFTRNPMYLGLTLVLLGAGVFMNAVSSLFVVAAFFIIVNAWYIPFEERAAAARFGEDYHGYCKRTRRWI